MKRYYNFLKSLLVQYIIIFSLLGLTGCGSTKSKIEESAIRFCHCHHSKLFILDFQFWNTSAVAICANGQFWAFDADDFVELCTN